MAERLEKIDLIKGADEKIIGIWAGDFNYDTYENFIVEFYAGSVLLQSWAKNQIGDQKEIFEEINAITGEVDSIYFWFESQTTMPDGFVDAYVTEIFSNTELTDDTDDQIQKVLTPINLISKG